MQLPIRGSSWLVIVPLLAAVAGGAPLAGAGARPTALGSWKGIIVYAPAELEVEIGIELFQGSDGILSGSIDIPTKPIHGEPLAAIEAQGDAISWELRRASGTFIYRGTLSADGDEIHGTYHERGKVYPFSLERYVPTVSDAEPAAPPLHTLSATAEELRARFNQDVGNVRLVLLLSPG